MVITKKVSVHSKVLQSCSSSDWLTQANVVNLCACVIHGIHKRVKADIDRSGLLHCSHRGFRILPSINVLLMNAAENLHVASRTSRQLSSVRGGQLCSWFTWTAITGFTVQCFGSYITVSLPSCQHFQLYFKHKTVWHCLHWTWTSTLVSDAACFWFSLWHMAVRKFVLIGRLIELMCVCHKHFIRGWMNS